MDMIVLSPCHRALFVVTEWKVRTIGFGKINGDGHHMEAVLEYKLYMHNISIYLLNMEHLFCRNLKE